MEDLNHLDLDLTGTSLTTLLPRQTLKCVTGEVRLERSKGRDGQLGALQLVVPLTLEEPGKDLNGNTVHPGFPTTDRILVEPVGNLTQDMINKRLAQFQCAILRTKAPGPFGKTDQYSSKQVLVTFDTRPDKNDPEVIYQDVKRYSAVKNPSDLPY